MLTDNPPTCPVDSGTLRAERDKNYGAICAICDRFWDLTPAQMAALTGGS